MQMAEEVSVRQLEAKDHAKCVEYCPWFWDVVTANGEKIPDVIFFYR
jgi:hypothetical protein